MGGTFSHIHNIGDGGLTMAFSQCLAGLLTISIQDLELTVAPIRDESKIEDVTVGSYLYSQCAEGSVTLRFGNLYSREVRKVIVELLLPAIESERNAEILTVTYSYRYQSFQTDNLYEEWNQITCMIGPLIFSN